MTSAGQFGPYPFIDSRGNALPGVEILIYDSTGTTLASLYSDRARTPLANPLPTGVADGIAGVDTSGNAIFWADADEYLMVVRYGGTQRYQAPITISADPDDANAVLSVNGRSGIVIGLAENADLVAEAATARANEGANAAAIATEASTRATQDGLLIPLTQRAAANGVATLDAGSKVPTAQLPALAITETFPVASQAAMLALTAQRGDVAIRTDLNKSFILSTDSPGTLADWKELLTPTDSVTSVNARVGVVSGLAEADASNVAASAAAWRSAIGAQATGTYLVPGDVGSTVQAHDGDLDAIALLNTAAFGRSLLEAANAAALRSAAGLGTAALTDTGTGAANVPTITLADLRYLLTADAAVSVKTWGARGDGAYVGDGALSAGSAVLGSVATVFTSADVGKAVQATQNHALTDGASTQDSTTFTSATAVFNATDVGSPVTSTATAAATYADGVIVGGSPTILTSATARFQIKDVGKTIAITGAGPAGALLTTTIASYQSPTQVTLTAAASTAVAAASFTITARLIIEAGTKIATYVNATTVTLSSAPRATATGISFTVKNRLILPAGTTILSFQSSTGVTLSNNAYRAATNCNVVYGTDDTAAIRLAIAAAGAGGLRFPNGIYVVSDTLTFATSGLTVEGLSALGGTTELISVAATNPTILVTAPYVNVRDIQLEGAGIGTVGVVFQHANRGDWRNVWAKHFNYAGYVAQMSWNSLPSGNNDLLKLTNVHGENNYGYGFIVPNYELDNNGISFVDCEMSNNDVHGLLYKGTGGKIFAGGYIANGHYGIKLGESTDSGITLALNIYTPWIESNGVGGIGCAFGKAARNIVYGNTTQDIDRTNPGNTPNLELQTSSATRGRHRLISGEGKTLEMEGTNLLATDPTGNADLTLTPQGTGQGVVSGALKVTGNLGANGATPARPAVTGDRGSSGAALLSLLNALDAQGYITNSSSVPVVTPGSGTTASVADVHADQTVVSSTAATTLVTLAIPVDVAAGDILRYTIAGENLNNTGSSQTFGVSLKLGATTLHGVSTQTQTTSANKHQFLMKGEILVVDPTNAQRGSMFVVWPAASASLNAVATSSQGLGAGGSGSATEDLTAGKSITFVVTLGASDANLSFTVHSATLSVDKR